MRPTTPIKRLTALKSGALIVTCSLLLAACADPASAPVLQPFDVALAKGEWPAATILPLLSGTAEPTRSSEAYGINDRGTVVGWSQRPGPCPGEAAFVLRDGVISEPLVTLPSGGCLSRSVALDVNANDAVVGWFMDGGGDKHPFMWTPAGGPVVLAQTGFDVIANAINNQGVVVGYNQSGPTSGHHALKWTSPTTVVDIHPVGYQSSVAVDINDDGEIVGVVCVSPGCAIGRWDASGAFELSVAGVGQPVGSLFNIPIQPLAISGKGIIAGSRRVSATADMPFFWKNSTLTDADVAPERVADVNDALRVVGSSVVPSVGVRRAFTRRGGAESELPQPVGYGSGWATGVNECGDVVGVVSNGATTRAILWQNLRCDRGRKAP